MLNPKICGNAMPFVVSAKENSVNSFGSGLKQSCLETTGYSQDLNRQVF